MTPALQWKRRACCSGMEGILGAMIGKYYCFFSVLLMLYSVCYILVFFIHIALYQNNNPNRLMVTCTKPNWSWNADNDDDSHDNDNDVEAEDGDDDHDDILK